jgi:hypothetical protein
VVGDQPPPAPAPRESPRSSLAGTCSCSWRSVLLPDIASSSRQRSMAE